VALLVAIAAPSSGATSAVSAIYLHPAVGIATASDELAAGHRRGDPLYVEVRVFNAVAHAVAARNDSNARLLDRMRTSARWKELDDAGRRVAEADLAAVEPPSFVVGSPAHPLIAGVTLRLVDSRGRESALTARPLAASSDVPARFELGRDDAATLALGVDASTLARLAPGTYQLRARLDTRGQDGMWNGSVDSAALELRITDGKERRPADEEQERLFAVGSFWLADHQFGELEKVARRMIALDQRSVGGWLHLGDALDGQGKPGPARDAFLRSRRLYVEDVVPTLSGPVEAPEYTLRRIREVEEKIGSGVR